MRDSTQCGSGVRWSGLFGVASDSEEHAMLLPDRTDYFFILDRGLLTRKDPLFHEVSYSLPRPDFK